MVGMIGTVYVVVWNAKARRSIVFSSFLQKLQLRLQHLVQLSVSLHPNHFPNYLQQGCINLRMGLDSFSCILQGWIQVHLAAWKPEKAPIQKSDKGPAAYSGGCILHAGVAFLPPLGVKWSTLGRRLDQQWHCRDAWIGFKGKGASPYKYRAILCSCCCSGLLSQRKK